MAPVIPLNSVVLVTGVNGFIASHIADQILLADYKIRGTARTAAKAEHLKAYWDKKYGPGKVEIVEVPELDIKGAFDEVVKGVSGICHVACNMSWTPDPNVLIPEVLAATTELLRAAAQEPRVKRFVYTSSINTCYIPAPNKKFKIDVNTWDEEATKIAWAPPPYTIERSPSVYAAGKIAAEQAVWKFVKENNPAFTVNAILPNVNFGPQLQPSTATSQGSSSNFITGLYLGQPQFAQAFPSQWYIHVQDHARLQVAALTDPDFANERVFAMAGKFTWSEILKMLGKLRPEREFVDDWTNKNDVDLSTVPNERGAELLRKMGRAGYTSLEETIADNIQGL